MTGTRQSLQVDARAILDALTARDAHILGSYLDLRTGAVFQLVDPKASGTDNEAIEAAMDQEPHRYAAVPLFDREYRLMCAFAEEVDDEQLAVKLDGVLRGQNAFRGFHHEIGASGASSKWVKYRQDALVKWALDWLHSLNIDPEWDLAKPEPEPEAQVAGLFHLLLLGERSTRDGVVHIRVVVTDPLAARRFFQRSARQLCEFRGEPWGALQGSDVFEREGIRLALTGSEIELEVRVPADITSLLGG